MKRLALTTALILSTAAPALAQSQLERQLGVPAGEYTLSELVELTFAAEQTGNGAIVNFGSAEDVTVSTANPVSARAEEIVRQQALNSDDGIDRLFADARGTTDSGTIVNARARQIVADLIAAD